ncbi:MAG: hypothetical protein KAH31_11900, partial [Candidatus Sabulitectum sp.]|nr:hypothetical protein [Candidatus Sabulitectum sp.]
KKNYAEALELGEKAHDENIIANSLCGLGFHCIDSGEIRKADSFLRRAASISSRTGNKPALIRVLYGLAALDRINGNPIRSAVTALALLHSPFADSESEGFCMELIGDLRTDLGNEKMEELLHDTDNVSLQELMDIHTVAEEPAEDGAYRTP